MSKKMRQQSQNGPFKKILLKRLVVLLYIPGVISFSTLHYPFNLFAR